MLFTFVGGRGHADPLAPIARAAVRAGHTVALAGQAAVASAFAARGIETFAIGPDTVGPARRPLLAPDRAREDAALRDSFAGRFARHRAAALASLCERWRPDVVVCDEVDFGGMIAAERLGIPHANVIVIAAGAFLRADLLAGSLDRVRAEHGLPCDPDLSMLSRDLVLAPIPPRFRDPRSPLPPTAHFLRPGARDEAAGPPRRPAARASRPTVYATLGTIFHLEPGDLFARIVAGIRELDVELIAALGDHVDPAELGPQPPNVRLEAFVPQASVLARSDAVVCHGGSGTVIGALAHGLPLALLPLGADQPDNASRCAALGVGVVLDAITATPREIRSAVETVLHEPPIAATPRRLATRSRSSPPPMRPSRCSRGSWRPRAQRSDIHGDTVGPGAHDAAERLRGPRSTPLAPLGPASPTKPARLDCAVGQPASTVTRKRSGECATGSSRRRAR
jgi:UDP:flavonoid glycosyltransferase YjiC (YdhE family)